MYVSMDFKKIKEDNKGFTLIELIVVIAIIAVLALIVVPKVTGQTKEADVAAHNANVRTLESAATMYIADGGEEQLHGQEKVKIKMIVGQNTYKNGLKYQRV